MNDAGECYGDQRLAQLVGEYGDLESEDLRARIVNEVRTFTGGTAQQDDMTLVLLKMDGVGV